MNRILTALLIMMMAGGLISCAPPKKAATGQGNTADGGRAIIAVQPEPKDPFKTILINGLEALQARGPLGKFGGTFYDNQIGDGPKTFNAWAAFDATSSTLSGMMFSGLVTTDAYTGDVVPYLAKEVKISDDKLTYTVTLRKGLKWSDGKPITSDDVVFTWNEIIKAGLGNASTRDVNMIAGQFPQVRKIDPYTIVFKTAKPFAPFLRNLGTPIAPAHILKPVVSKGNDAFSAFWSVNDADKNPEKFISNGMWILDTYEPRLRVSFKRNPNFFMVNQKGQRLPYLERYVISFVGDLNTQQLQFEQGKADTYGVPGKFVARMRQLKTPDFKLYNLGPTSGTTFMAFNLNTRKGQTGQPLVDSIHAKWFNNPRFRKAIALTINRQDIVDNILKGVGAPLYTSESLSSIYLNKDLAERLAKEAVNIEQAKTLLKEGGFHWDKAGQLLDAQNHPVEFSLYTNSGNDEREAVGVNIKQDLSQLGIKVNFKPMDFNVLVSKMNEGSWETIVMGLTGDNLEPHSGVNVWKSDGSLHLFNQRKIVPGKPTNLNDRLPWEKQLDQLFEQGAQTFEKAQRQPIYSQYQEVIAANNPMIYLYSPLAIVAVRDRIQNFDPTPLGTFHNLEEIWINDGAEKNTPQP